MKPPLRLMAVYQKSFFVTVLKQNMLTKTLIFRKAPHLNANHTALNDEQMHFTLSNELQA